MIVERTDFISVPVTDMERAKRFYGETLGLPEVAHPEQGFPEYQLGENVSLYLLQMENIGQTFTAPHSGSVALRVEDVHEAAWMNMAPAVIVNVQRQPGANTIAVVDRIKALLPTLAATLPASA